MPHLPFGKPLHTAHFSAPCIADVIMWSVMLTFAQYSDRGSGACVPLWSGCRYRGVSRKKGKWEAKVMVDRKWAYRELFDSETEAAHAYDAAVWRLKPREAKSYVNFKERALAPAHAGVRKPRTAHRCGSPLLCSAGPLYQTVDSTCTWPPWSGPHLPAAMLATWLQLICHGSSRLIKSRHLHECIWPLLKEVWPTPCHLMVQDVSQHFSR